MCHRWVPPLAAQGMHEVAYSGGLARPLIAPESALAGLNADALAAFVARNYTPSRMTLAGAGVAQVRAAGLRRRADRGFEWEPGCGAGMPRSLSPPLTRCWV